MLQIIRRTAMAKDAKKAVREKARKIVGKAKTAAELNIIIARHLDILESGSLEDTDIRLAESVSGLIGRQVSVENAKISYERLATLNGKAYAFVS
jgi:hypothetical protein